MCRPEPIVTLPRTVAEVLRQHVTLEMECIDRMYLNVYVADLQHEPGVAWFLRHHRGHPVAASYFIDPISKAFLAAIEAFVKRNHVPLLTFAKGQRKDALAAQYHAAFTGSEGVLFVGKAQEKTWVFRTEKRTNPRTGQKYPWLVRTTSMVNHFYFYCIDEDFGPFFLKFCSYFPYTAKLCINGHEYVKRQLVKEGIAHESLDNGILSCADPQRLQQICDGLSAKKINALLRKWLARLPHPFTAADRAAGYRYEISILQAEFSLTQVLDRPLVGRIFFEEVIRENLDLGRPDHVQLVFQRPIHKRTPGCFRTRVVTEGVVPSLYIDYKGCRIKQYHKEGRALRTETVVNNTVDFQIGKRLQNLPALREVGFRANRRLLDVQHVSHDCAIGEEVFRQVTEPITVHGQRASALRYADPCVLALFSALLVFRLLPRGFANHELREHLAPLLGEAPSALTQGRMTYQLRRLRLHGLIVRRPGTHRYAVTSCGFRIALFFTRSYARVVRPGLTELCEPSSAADTQLRRAADRFEAAIDRYVARAKVTQQS
jgi:hypothetical protein